MSVPRYGAGGLALVTGGGSGIGEALARRLARRGAHVVVTDRRGDEAERVARAIASNGGSAEAHALDVRSSDHVGTLVETVHARRGAFDVVFANAGIGVAGEVLDLTPDDFRDIVEVNLLGVTNTVLATYPAMVARGAGHLVLTASMSGLMPSPITAAYALTKFGVVGFARSLRVEAAHYGVRVTALCPGVIATPILHGGAYGRFARKPTEGAIDAMFAPTAPMDADQFAGNVLDALPSDPNTLVVPARWRAIDWLSRLSPELAGRAASMAFRTMKRAYDAAPRRG